MSRPRGNNSFVAAREQPPRLVLLYAVFTALGVAAAAAVILVVVRQTDMAQAQRQAIDRAQLAAHAVLRPELRTVDLSQPLSAKRRRQLDRVFGTRLLVEGIRGATIYRTNGRITYSTASNEIGGEATRSHVLEATSGTTVSELATTKDGSRVHRTYLPLAISPGNVRGAVRVDQEYEPIEMAVHRSSWLIAGVLEGLLFVLFVAFVPVLARVSARVRRQVDELDYVATHDEVTGLPNRLGFRRATEETLVEARTGALLLLDLDGFSEINESLGSASGDVLLAKVAERLQFELDDCAFFARLGDDEFGVLLHDAGPDEIEAVAKQVEQVLVAPFVVDGVRVATSVSMGAALAEPGCDFGVVLRRAGTALSRAKGEGQSGVQVSGPEHDLRDVSHLAVTAELREAIECGQLLVYYQPQCDLTTRRIRGVEALLRWDHPVDGILSASEFISHAERSGLAGEIRRFVLETSAAQLHEWNELGIDLELAVNLSPVDLIDVSLPDEIATLLDRYRIPPGRLILEITERMLIADERRAARVIDQLGVIGVRVAIDDFGTGYSSLASLRRFSVQQIKLDRGLLAGVPGDPGAEAIVGGCVEIAHGVGASVVAEGVETRAQWKFVSMMGCDIAQGYLIGRPTPADGLTARLNVPRHIPLVAVSAS